jgi:hypothetical protein
LMHPMQVREELETRIKRWMKSVDRNGRGYIALPGFYIDSTDGDMMISKGTGGNGFLIVYERDAEWLMKTYVHDEAIKCLEALQRAMILEDLAEI